MVGAKITLERIEADAEIVERNKGIPKEVSKTVLETVIEDRQARRRQPKPPPPEGGICLSQAGRQYGMPKSTLSRWVKRGLIPILSRTSKELYVDENILSKIVSEYKQNAGRGKWTIFKKTGGSNDKTSS